MATKKKTTKKSMDLGVWLYASLILNVVFIVFAVVLWIIIAGAGTNRYSSTIFSTTQSFVTQHYCSPAGYMKYMDDVDMDKTMTAQEKVMMKNEFAFAVCGKGMDNPLIQQYLKSAKLY